MHGKKKLLFLNHWSIDLGGAEKSLLDILKFSSQQYECHLISSEEGELTKLANKEGVYIHIVKVNKNIAKFKRDNRNPFKLFSAIHFIPYILKVKAIIKQIKPDLIYANVPKSHILLLLLYLTGVKIPGIIHMREIFTNPIILFLYNTLYNQHIKIISISKAVEKHLPPKLGENSTVLYNGISIPTLVQDLKNQTKIIKLIYIGRVVPWKGCHLLIDILNKVKDMEQNHLFQLDIYGDTIYWDKKYRKDLQIKISQLNLDEQCFLHGATDNISGVLLQSNIFLNASSNEPFGRVLAEASAHSLPVITFKSGAANEVIDPTCGILIEDNNINAFAEAIIYLANNESKCIELGISGRKKAVQFFNKNIQLKKISEFINKQTD